MQISHTYAELKAAADRRRRIAAARAPNPEILNLEALVQFTAPREFDVGGVGLRAPPLPFRAGVRLLFAANALKALERDPGKAPPDALEAARSVAASVLPQIMRPVRFWHRLRGGWLRPVLAWPADELEGFLRALLAVPDDFQFPVSTKPARIDFMDTVVEIAMRVPVWIDPRTGLPRLWAQWVYASRAIGRGYARQKLLQSGAVRMAWGANLIEWKQFQAEQKELAGWTDA